MRSRPTAEPTVCCPEATDVYVPSPSFVQENEMVASGETNSPAKPNVSSRTFSRSPPPCQTISKVTCDGTGAGLGEGERELTKSWKSGIAKLSRWKRAWPLAPEMSTADGGTGTVQKSPDGLMPGLKSWT